jgi:dihydropteroate synthase
LKLRCGKRWLALDKTVVMGVLNVTPDSFSDGGQWLDAAAAVEHGLEMAAAGAAIIDVGGESTRPGAEDVPEKEELDRVLPVIEGLSGLTDALISIDTRKPVVARRAVEAGASIINDTTGEPTDYAIDAVAAETNVAVVMMHSRGTPATMRDLAVYDDVVRDVATWLRQRAGKLENAGVARNAIVLDPGIGFAKSAGQSLALLRGMQSFLELGYPVLVGPSRKSFIGAVLGLPADDRLEGTAATVAWATAQGVHIVRVHDVAKMIRVVEMTTAIMAGSLQ